MDDWGLVSSQENSFSLRSQHIPAISSEQAPKPSGCLVVKNGPPVLIFGLQLGREGLHGGLLQGSQACVFQGQPR